jgi:uncharacterized flavoprotein (TIGR03862 family)
MPSQSPASSFRAFESSASNTCSTDIAIIGAGPAGLMAAERLTGTGFGITVFDAMPTPGRKFLMAGRGGLNLTHSEDIGRFIARYGAASRRMAAMLERFTPAALRDWADSLGAETYIGSSGRVFPRAMKASGLLRRWLQRLNDADVRFRLRRRLVALDGTDPVLALPDGSRLQVRAKAVLLALGGASWPKLGSDAAWVPLLAERGVTLRPLRPSNCGFDLGWSPHFRARGAGRPLKNVALAFGEQRVRGEMMLTAGGIEGGAVYALSAPLREALEGAAEPVFLHLDLKPQMDRAALERKLQRRRNGRSLAPFLAGELRLPAIAYPLLREAADPLPQDAAKLAALIKHVPLRILRARPIAEAISSAGGIAFDALDDNLMLRAMPGVFAAGEMLDWEAPTGGYLLQGCMSSAVVAAEGVLDWLRAT